MRKLNTLSNKILCWAYQRGEFCLNDVAKAFPNDKRNSLQHTLYGLVDTGELEKLEKKSWNFHSRPQNVYVCNENPVESVFYEYESVGVGELKDCVTTLTDKTVITSRGRIIGFYTPIGC